MLRSEGATDWDGQAPPGNQKLDRATSAMEASSASKPEKDKLPDKT